ncbi:hypothetical protein [Brucella sp. NBRC 14130]|uniref:TraG/VirB4 family ATPase n=1 Tax=Brucella sp. NBRC 14130 TaxID=3075483 RepID=UPI00334268FB
MAAAEKLGYQPNARARGLATGRTEAIGLVFPLERLQLAQTNFVDVLTGISDVVTRRNYSLLLTPFSDNEQEVLRKLATSRLVDGIIITRPLVDDPRIPLLRDVGIPFVVHGRSDVDTPYSFVDIDNAAVFEKLGGLLLDYGHERIAVFNSFLRFRYAHARREGYAKALAMRGRMRSGIGDLADRLKEWTTGDKGWLFNNPTDRLDFAGSVIGFDMTEILSDKRTRSAALLYMFHRIQEILDGRPSMIFLDEGWRLLDDEVFSGFIKDWLKTIRKMNGIVGFGTQSAADVVRSDLRNTIIEQTMTNIFFPNASADEESYRKAFGLSEKEFRFVKQADKTSRTFLIKHAQDSVIARLDLSAMPDLVKVLSGRPETVRECQTLRETYGDEPAAWLPHFCGWTIPEAADA